MRKHLWCVTFSVLFLATTIISWRSEGANKSDEKVNSTLNAKELFNQYVNSLYQTASLQQTGLAFDVFEKAVTGYTNLKLNHLLPQSSSVLTVVDFTKSSREKRMWIIDLFYLIGILAYHLNRQNETIFPCICFNDFIIMC